MTAIDTAPQSAPKDQKPRETITPTMTQPEQTMNKSLPMMIATQMLVAVVAILFVLSLLLFFFYLYAKRHGVANPATTNHSPRVRFILSPELGAVPRRGLDPCLIQALPVTVFRSEDFKQGLDCSVCLSELSNGEKARVLPDCNHGFHVECIDMWLHSNNTCPLCRIPVSVSSGDDSGTTHVVEFPPVSQDGNFEESTRIPNIVGDGGLGNRWCSSSAGSSSGLPGRVLAIEIPRRGADGFHSPSSPLPLSRHPEEETRSPTLARLRSLGRLLSRGRSPRRHDIEQGTIERSLLVPKTPTNS